MSQQPQDYLPRHNSNHTPPDRLSISSSARSAGSPRRSKKVPSHLRISFLKRNSSGSEMGRRNLSDMIWLNPVLSHKCELCEQPHQRTEMDCIGDCSHLFCFNCLNTYAVYKINIMEDVTCPREGCSAALDPRGSVFYRLPQESKDRYNRNSLWKQTVSNPNLRLCPTQNCEGVMDTSDGILQCDKCRVRFCRECQLPEHQGPCDSNFQENFKEWKRCPRCNIFIERIEGCNHMVCRCNMEFCYVCRAHWSDQHYECEIRPYLVAHRWVEEWPRWKQLLFGICLVILSPLALAITIVSYLGGVVVVTVLGFFCGPVLIIGETQRLQGCLGCLICPLLLIAGAIMGFFGSLCYGIYIAGEALKEYWRIILLALCQYRIENNNEDLYEDGQFD